MYHFFYYIVFLILSSLITFSLGIFALSRQKIRGSGMFSLWMFTATWWAVCNSMELTAASLELKVFWSNMQFIAYAFFPLEFFILTVRIYGGSFSQVKKENMKTTAALAVLPLITSVLVWFDGRTGLVRYGFSLAHGNFCSFLNFKNGPWLIVHISYSYALYIAGAAWNIASLFSKSRVLYRRQNILFLIGTSFTYIPNFLYVTGNSPVEYVNFAPAFFSITGILFYIAIFKFHFLVLIPLARNEIFENISEGVIITDGDGVILEHNLNALLIFGKNKRIPSGSVIQTEFPLLDAAAADSESGTAEKTIEHDGKVIEYTVSKIRNSSGMIRGCVYMIRDVTELQLARQKILEAQKESAVRAEQARVARDLHDNIGQILSFAKIQSQAAMRQIQNGKNDAAVEYLKTLQGAVEKSYSDLRAYIFNLRQPQLLKKRLPALLREFVNDARKSLSCRITLSLPKKIPAFFDSPEVKANLLSWTREAVNNAAKHSECSVISVSLKLNEGGGSEYSVRDDGNGISGVKAKGRRTKSSGMKILQERARFMGGEFKIESAVGQGTLVKIVWA